METSDFESIQTWPRSQNPQKLLSDYQTRAQLQTTLANLKHYSTKCNDEKINELVNSLYTVLMKNGGSTEKALTSNHSISSPPKTRHGEIGVIREEPHFESMIICDTTTSKPVSRVSSIQFVDGVGGETRVETVSEVEREPVSAVI